MLSTQIWTEVLPTPRHSYAVTSLLEGGVPSKTRTWHGPIFSWIDLDLLNLLHDQDSTESVVNWRRLHARSLYTTGLVARLH